MVEKTTIPTNHQEFCKAVARLCREYGLERFAGTYRPPSADKWDGDMAMTWEQGRHGEDSDKLFIESKVRVWTRLGPKPTE